VLSLLKQNRDTNNKDLTIYHDSTIIHHQKDSTRQREQLLALLTRLVYIFLIGKICICKDLMGKQLERNATITCYRYRYCRDFSWNPLPSYQRKTA